VLTIGSSSSRCLFKLPDGDGALGCTGSGVGGIILDDLRFDWAVGLGLEAALLFGDFGVFGDAAAGVAGVAALAAGVEAGGVGVDVVAEATALSAGWCAFFFGGGGGFR
jgi:hypothetical protein